MSSKVTIPKNTKLERNCDFRQHTLTDKHYDEHQQDSVSNDSEGSNNSSDTFLKQTDWEEAQRLIAHRALSRSHKSDRGKLLRKEQIAEMVKRIKSSEINLQKKTELQKETQNKLNELNRKTEKLSVEKKQLERAIYHSDHEKKEILRKYKTENFGELIDNKEKTIKWLTVRCAEMHGKISELAQQLKKSSEENGKIKSMHDVYKRKYLKYKTKLSNTNEKNAHLAYTVQQEISRREDSTAKKKKEFDGKYNGNVTGKKTLLEQLQQPDPIRSMLSCAFEVDDLSMKKSNAGDIKNRFNSATETVENSPQKVDETAAEPVIPYIDTIREKLYSNKKQQRDNCYFNYPSFSSICEADVFRTHPTSMGLPDYLPSTTKTDFNSVRNLKTEHHHRSDTSYRTADEEDDLKCDINLSNSSTGLSRTKTHGTAAKASSSKSMTNIGQHREKQGPSSYHSSPHKTDINERVSKSAKTPMDIFAEIFGKGFRTLATYAQYPEDSQTDAVKNRREMPPPSSSHQTSLKSRVQTSKDWQQSQKVHLDLPNETLAKLTCSTAAHRRHPVNSQVAKRPTSEQSHEKKEDLTPRLTTTIRLHTPGSHNRHIVTVNGKVLVFEPPTPSGWSTLQHEEPLTNQESALLSSFEDSPEMQSLWRDLAIAYARTDLRQGKSAERIPFVTDVKPVYTDFDKTNPQPLQVSRRVDAILLADNPHQSETQLVKSPSFDSDTECCSVTESRKSVSDIQTLCLAEDVEEERNENLNAFPRSSLPRLNLAEDVEEERNENLDALPRSSLSSLSLEENVEEERNEMTRSSLSSLSDTELRSIDSDCEDLGQQWEVSSSSTFRVLSSTSTYDESSLHSTSSVTSVMLEQLLSESLDLMKTIEEQDSDDLMKETETVTESSSNAGSELSSIKN